MKTRITKFVGGAASLFIAIELLARFSGIADVPIYHIDDQIGYIPAANQSGCFLRKNDWQFNDRSMGAPPYRPEGKRNILLLGDSIVYGGNAYRQAEKLGPCLQEQLGGNTAVWPVGAGKWAVLNEITYLERNPDLAGQMDWLVWVVITGDFRHRTLSWSPLVHPPRPPLLASVYGLQRYVLPALHITRDPEYLPIREENVAVFDAQIPAFANFLAALKQRSPRLKILIVLYPDSYELKNPGGDTSNMVARSLKAHADSLGIRFLEVAGDGRWQPNLYRDFVHPNPEGDRVLAACIRDALTTNH